MKPAKLANVVQSVSVLCFGSGEPLNSADSEWIKGERVTISEPITQAFGLQPSITFRGNKVYFYAPCTTNYRSAKIEVIRSTSGFFLAVLTNPVASSSRKLGV